MLEETVRLKNTGFETRTLWDWMQLLIIPLALTGGALYLQRAERTVERQSTEIRAKLEREIATDRQQEAALQSYLDHMADLLLNENLLTSGNEELRNVARIRTLTVLRGLDARRKGLLLLFLYESGLILERLIVDLDGADLSGAELYSANLSGANLVNVNLNRAELSTANLSGARLIKANLNRAQLIDTELSGANLSEADLRDAKVSDQQLATAQSLKLATMPDGTIHE